MLLKLKRATLDNGVQKIENENENDIINLAKLFDAISKHSPPGQFNWTQETAYEEILVSQSLVFVLNTEIISFLTFRKYSDRFEIMACGTEPQLRLNGSGTKLLQELQIIAAQQGLPILLEVHEFNASAIGFYHKCGFQHLLTRKGYYSDGQAALIMKWVPISHNQS